MNRKIYIGNENKWVVTDKTYKRVLLSNRSLPELQKEVKKLNIKDAVIMFIPQTNTTLAPKCH